MAKQLLFSDDRPQEAARRASRSWPTPSASRSGRPAGTSSSTSRSAARPSPRTASPSPRRSSCTTRSRTWAPSSSTPSPRRPATSPATAPPPPPSWPWRSIKEGLRNITAGGNPMAVQRGIDKAVEAAVEQLHDDGQAGLQEGGDRRRSAPSRANNDPTIGELMADAFEKVGKDGVITVEEGKTSETDARVRRGHAVRQGLHLARTSSTNPTDDGVRARRRADPDPREEDQQPPRAAAAAGEGRPRPASRC